MDVSPCLAIFDVETIYSALIIAHINNEMNSDEEFYLQKLWQNDGEWESWGSSGEHKYFDERKMRNHSLNEWRKVKIISVTQGGEGAPQGMACLTVSLFSLTP